MLLSKDDDIHEQFYKLTWLLDTHYRGMLLASRFWADSRYFAVAKPPANSIYIHEFFEASQCSIVRFGENTLRTLLPRQFVPAKVISVNARTALSTLSFDLENEMVALLTKKAVSAGLNTDLFGGANCHFWLYPADVPVYARSALIGPDKRIAVNANRIPLHDINQAISTGERRKIAISPAFPLWLPSMN